MIGPGKYDSLCTDCLLRSQARLALLCIIDGNQGSGFSLSASDTTLLAALPSVLEEMAHQIRADLERRADVRQ